MSEHPGGAPLPRWRRRLRFGLLFTGALFFLLEEWLWRHLTAFLLWIERLPPLRWVDARLAALPPAIALVAICAPTLLLFPVKLFALWLLGTGHMWAGLGLGLAAKILSTALVARIFFACRPQLLRMPWFARLYDRLMGLRTRIHAWIEQQPAWKAARESVRRLRGHVRAWMQGRRFDENDPSVPRPGVLARWRMRRQRRRDAEAR